MRSLLVSLLLLGALSLYPQSVPMGALPSSGIIPSISIASSHATLTSASVTSASTTLSSGAAGDLIVCSAHGDATSYPTITMSDGTSSLTALTQAQYLGSAHDFGQVFYLLSANSGSATYTATFSFSSEGTEVACVDAHSSTGTWHYDASNQSSGNGTSVSTGTITTTGTNEFVFFPGKLYNTAANTSNPLINGGAPSEGSFSPLSTYDHYYYRILTSTFSGGAGTKIYSTSTYWVAELTAFYAN